MSEEIKKKGEQTFGGAAARTGFWVANIFGCLGVIIVWVFPILGVVQAALFFCDRLGYSARPGVGGHRRDLLFARSPGRGGLPLE